MCTITAFDPPPFDKLAASNALTEAGLDKHVADGIVHVTSGAISQLDKHRDEEWQTRRGREGRGMALGAPPPARQTAGEVPASRGSTRSDPAQPASGPGGHTVCSSAAAAWSRWN